MVAFLNGLFSSKNISKNTNISESLFSIVFLNVLKSINVAFPKNESNFSWISIWLSTLSENLILKLNKSYDVSIFLAALILDVLIWIYWNKSFTSSLDILPSSLASYILNINPDNSSKGFVKRVIIPS